MRAWIVALVLLLAVPPAGAALPVDPASDVPVYAPVGHDHGISNAQYQRGNSYCVSYAPSPLPSLAAPTLSFLRFESSASRPGWSDLAFHLNTVPNADGSCAPLVIHLTAPLADYPASTFYDMQVETSCGRAYVSVTHYATLDVFSIGVGPDGCIPGLATWSAAFAYVPVTRPSTYQACDPLEGLCPGASETSGGASCGDGADGGSTTVAVLGAGRSCDGAAPGSWYAYVLFAGANGDAGSCNAYAIVVYEACPTQAGLPFEAAPWGHLLP
ncbi:MAG: hypothetical protein QOE90_1705 [Thermoplasmata archaeon]|jgi:hypothetical protein|nr:hypothetical protein [Thermoplasmata archaeon]